MAQHLELRSITKRYPGVTALRDVSFRMKYGESLGLVGENGAGKSTLLDILCGLQRPDEGELVLHGRNVVFDQPAQAVADKLEMHINSVYRAKEQVTRMLQEKVAAMKDED